MRSDQGEAFLKNLGCISVLFLTGGIGKSFTLAWRVGESKNIAGSAFEVCKLIGARKMRPVG